jgi:glycosyltransferase involved in cell wall biosynthesis
MSLPIDLTHLDTKIPILCFSTTDWYENWGSRQHIMLRMAQRGHPVLFIERQVGPEQLIRDPALRLRKIAAWKSIRLNQLIENFWTWQPPLLPPGRYYNNHLNQLGQKILIRQIRSLILKLGLPSPILWLYPPQSAPLLGAFGERLSLYHCIENFSGNQAGIKRRVMQSEERLLLQRADLVFTHSEGLFHLYGELAQREITLVPSAADVSYFQSISLIDPLVSQIPHPSLGVVGTLDGRLNVELLESIVHSHPTWHLVLIGQWHPERVDLQLLKNFSNVHFLGQQPYDKLPYLLNGLDIFLIPYVLNEMTVYISPIKLYEYLAVGKPIVSTGLPEVMKYKDYVRVASDAHDFIQNIQIALEEDTPAKVNSRRVFARQHSWEARLEKMLGVIEETLKRKSVDTR